MPDTDETIALFPLNTVLFPGGPLALRIFEPRYLRMVSECLKADRGFGVCLISDGAEAGTPAECHDVGTLARIVDWDRLPDGLLGVRGRGERRFRVQAREVAEDGLITAGVSWIDDPEPPALPAGYDSLVTRLREVLDENAELYGSEPRRFDDALWVSYRMAEVLPFDMASKQMLLELDDPLQRLRWTREAAGAVGWE